MTNVTPGSTGKPQLSQKKKLGILLAAAGQEFVIPIFERIPEDRHADLLREIGRAGDFSEAVVAPIIEEFLYEAAVQSSFGQGGWDTAINLIDDLVARGVIDAESKDRVSRRIFKERQAPSMAELRKVEPDVLSQTLRDENPQIVALVLAHLDPKDASKILLSFGKQAGDISLRMAKLDKVSPATLNLIEEKLGVDPYSSGNLSDVGGTQAVAEILNFVSRQHEEEILDYLGGADKDLRIEIESLMFTFADLAKLDETSVSTILGEIPVEKLALALRRADKELLDLIYGVSTKRFADNLKQTIDNMGPVRASDVDRAQTEIIERVRRMDEEGLIMLVSGSDDDIIF